MSRAATEPVTDLRLFTDPKSALAEAERMETIADELIAFGKGFTDRATRFYDRAQVWRNAANHLRADAAKAGAR